MQFPTKPEASTAVSICKHGSRDGRSCCNDFLRVIQVKLVLTTIFTVPASEHVFVVSLVDVNTDSLIPSNGPPKVADGSPMARVCWDERLGLKPFVRKCPALEGS